MYAPEPRNSPCGASSAPRAARYADERWVLVVDDAERLVEADALLAKGDRRGELMVVQCELSSGSFSRERGIALRRREQELLTQRHAWSNLEDLAKGCTFRRGVVDELSIDVETFEANEDEIWRRAPHARWIRLERMHFQGSWADLEPRVERLFASGRLRYFGAPQATIRTDPQTMQSLGNAIGTWLCRSPDRLRPLHGLSLTNVEDDLLWELLVCEDAANLEELELEGRALHRRSHPYPKDTLLRPRRLKLMDNFTRGDDEVAALGSLYASPFMSRVTDLQTTALEPILDHPWAENLRSLRIYPDDDDPRLLELAASSPRLAKLEHLRIDAYLGADLNPGLPSLGSPARLDSLRTLRFHGATSPSLRRLLKSPIAEQLELIDVRGTNSLEREADALRALWDGVLLVGFHD